MIHINARLPPKMAGWHPRLCLPAQPWLRGFLWGACAGGHASSLVWEEIYVRAA